MRSALAFAALAAAAAAAAEPSPERREALVEFVRHDCGACHGLTLKGGLGPSLERAALAGRDAEQMAYVILNGRRGTAMPPWRGLLSEAEAKWIADALKQGFPQ